MSKPKHESGKPSLHLKHVVLYVFLNISTSVAQWPSFCKCQSKKKQCVQILGHIKKYCFQFYVNARSL